MGRRNWNHAYNLFIIFSPAPKMCRQQTVLLWTWYWSSQILANDKSLYLPVSCIILSPTTYMYNTVRFGRAEIMLDSSPLTNVTIILSARYAMSIIDQKVDSSAVYISNTHGLQVNLAFWNSFSQTFPHNILLEKNQVGNSVLNWN